MVELYAIRLVAVDVAVLNEDIVGPKDIDARGPAGYFRVLDGRVSDVDVNTGVGGCGAV